MKEEEESGHFCLMCLPNTDERDHVFPDDCLKTTERERVTVVPTEVQVLSYNNQFYHD